MSLSLKLLSSLLLGSLAISKLIVVILQLLSRDSHSLQFAPVSDELRSVVTNPMDLITDDHHYTEDHENGRDGEAYCETNEIHTLKFGLFGMTLFIHAEFICEAFF